MNSQTLNFYIKMISDFSDVQSNVKSFQKVLSQLKLSDDLKNSFSNIFEDFEKEAKKYQKFLDSGFKNRKDVTGLEGSGERVSKILTRLQTKLKLISADDLQQVFKIDTSLIQQAEAKIANINKQISQITVSTDFKESVKDITKQVDQLGTKSKFADNLKKALSEGDIKGAEEALGKLVENHRQFNDDLKNKAWSKGIQELTEALNKLKTNTGLEELLKDSEEAEKELKDLSDIEFDKLVKAFANAVSGAEAMTKQYKELHNTTVQTATAQQNMAAELENFRQKALQFFSIGNAVQLFKRAVTSAVETVKELDKVMTQTAVVTDFSVGDMWSQLPEYTQRANELGVSIKGAYESATLYYQQGLSTNEVTAVSAETLKMARIAGLDYVKTTDLMTAALRGFNMEIDEQSAKRVNDVYSKLAAITASDTKEIATAMTKTASIANNANMEFETTAAFLSQIIETTRESAETAGTAMKTVIARFQELKKDPAEIGEVDGEVVDANKIETALRTIGVSLRDASGQFRDLDDVFLEIASKWDGLDTNTQRYIATMAAGSRQQSRFIAMMSDYERTMELVDAANNSAGASQEQFEKTLESLDSKLNQLKNAWDEFAMGLANSSLVKAGVDILTNLLEIVNKITGAFGDTGSAIAKLGLAFGALKFGKQLFSGTKIASLLGGKTLNKDATNAGTTAGKSFSQGLAEGISNPKEFGKTLQTLFTKTLTPEDILPKNFGEKTLSSLFTRVNAKNLNIDKLKETLENSISTALPNMDPKLVPQLENLKKSISTADASKLKEINSELEKMGIKSKISADMISADALKVKTNWEAVASTATGVGMAFMGMGAILKELGLEEFGDAVSKIGTILMTLGSIMSVVLPLKAKIMSSEIAAAIKAIPGIGTILGVIGAVTAAFIVLAAAIKTPKERLEEANKGLKAAEEAANTAAEAYDNLKESLDSISEKENALDGLTKNTQEYKDAVKELNQEVLDLLQKYPELSRFITSEGGVLTIDYEKEVNGKTASDVVKDYETRVENSQAAVLGNQYRVAEETKNVAYSNTGLSVLASELSALPADRNVDENNELINDLANAINNGEIPLVISDNLPYGGEEATQNRENLTDWLVDNQNLDREIAEIYANQIATNYLPNLEKYGQETDSANAQIDATALSLAARALANTDLSKYSDEVQNMADVFTNSISQETLENQLENISTSGTMREAEEEFARLKGWERIGNNKFQYFDQESGEYKTVGKKEGYTDENIKYQLAAMKAQEAASNSLQNFANQVDDISLALDKNDLGKGELFKQIFSGNEGSAITYSGLTEAGITPGQEINAEELEEQARSLYNSSTELQELYPNFEAFSDLYYNSLVSASDRYANAIETLEKTGLNIDLNQLGNLSSENIAGLSEHLYQSLLSGGREATQELSTILMNAIPEDAEEAERFVGLLNALDWSSQEGIRGFSDAIKESGIQCGLSEEEINALEERMIELANISENLTLENVKEELKSLQELSDDIEGREDSDRTFTDADKENLIKAGIDEDLFVSKGPDEWVYIGESLEGLLFDINEHTAEILGKITEDINDKVEQGKLWEAAAETKEVKFADGSVQDFSIVKQIEGLLDGSFTYLNEKGEPVNPEAEYSFSQDKLKELAAEVGIDATNATVDEIVDKLAINYEKYWGPNGSTYKNNLAEQDQELRQVEQQKYYSISSGQAMIDTGVDTAIAQKAREDVLDATIAEEGLAENLKDAQKDLKKYDATLLKAHVIDTKKAAEEVDKLNESISDNFEAFKNAEKGSFAYNEALTKITENAKNVFGDHVDESFVEAYAEDFLLLEQGGEVAEAAFARISNAAATMYLETLDFGEETEAKLSEIKSLTSELDNLDFGISGTADFSDIFNELAALMGSAEAAAKYLESMGYETTYKQIGWDYIRQPDDGSAIPDYLPVPKYRVVLSKKSSSGTGYRPSSGGGGGSGSSSTPVTPEIDKLYNLEQDLSDQTREIERLARAYERLYRGINTNAEQLIEATEEELKALAKQEAIQEKILEGRRLMLEAAQKEYADVENIVWFNSKDETVEINYEAYVNIRDEKLLERVEEARSTFEELVEQYKDAQDAISDIADDVKEIKERGKEEYIDLEADVLDALVDRQQKIIDNQQEEIDAINNAASDLLDAVQKNIDKLRQDKANEKTEESLAEKERRLAYLRQDTSGANALEIKQLEEEIANERESYEDSLIDQALQDLQDQNDLAAEQRERQIELAQSQLDWAEETGYYAAEATRIVQESLALFRAGAKVEDLPLYNLLRELDGVNSMSNAERNQWLENIAEAIGAASIYDSGVADTEHYDPDTDYMALMQSHYKTNEQKIDDQILKWNEFRNRKLADNPELDAIYDSYTPETLEQYLKNWYASQGGASGGSGYLMSLPSKTKLSSAEITNLQKGLNSLIDADHLSGPKLSEDGVKGTNTNNKLREFQRLIGATVDGDWGPNTYNALRKSKFTAFKTGGLADYTGPAWLDGTKSKPELVLNARDTENFLALKDVLSNLFYFRNSDNNPKGDNYFDITIQVEELSNDYDVDQLANRIKGIIYEDSMYRNVNTINLLR